MTNKMKRYAAFLLCLVMVLTAMPALAADGVGVSGAVGLGGLTFVEEETPSGVNPAGPVLGKNVALELTIDSPKTFSVYGYDWTNVKSFFDNRPDVTFSNLVKTLVPDLLIDGHTQVYLYDFTLTVGALYLDSIYPSNVVLYDGEKASAMNGGSWTLKAIANTNPADLVPKGQLLDDVNETINAKIGQTKTVSFYGFDYTQPKGFFNDSTVEVAYERFPVPGAYANGAHAVYLYNMSIKLNQEYNTGDGGRLYTSNIVYYNNNEATISYYDNWRINVTDDVPVEDVTIGTETETTPEVETETTETVEEPDLSNVRLLVSSNLDENQPVKVGTEMVIDATIEGGEGMKFHIWWQYSTDDGQTWTDVPGAVGAQYKEVITRENADMVWRACADFISWDDAE